MLVGMLSTAGEFDYELVREYVLNIEAKDAGDPPLSDMCMVTVTISDANDNKPTFSQLTYSASVREDSKVGDQIIQVRYLSVCLSSLRRQLLVLYYIIHVHCLFSQGRQLVIILKSCGDKYK